MPSSPDLVVTAVVDGAPLTVAVVDKEAVAVVDNEAMAMVDDALQLDGSTSRVVT